MAPPPLVVTGLGKIRGRRVKTSRSNRSLISFRGVPYARPPTGERRLARPLPVQPWERTLDCSGKESPVCMQVNVLGPESR